MFKGYWIATIIFLNSSIVLSQSQALTRPEKYLKPTLETKSDVSEQLSPFAWTVFVDRENVKVYKDRGLKNEDASVSLKFMQRLIVAEETEQSVLLVDDIYLDSITFSDQSKRIGWVSKNNLVLWDRFLWGNGSTRLLALTSWNELLINKATNLPNSFGQLPRTIDRYFIFNVVKEDVAKSELLISLRTFNNQASDLFCWVPKSILVLMQNRNGVIPNREFVTNFSANSPKIFASATAAASNDQSKVIYSIDSVRTDEGFVIVADRDVPKNSFRVTWFERNGRMEGYFTLSGANQELFKKGLLLNRQEFSQIRRIVEILAACTSKEEYRNAWRRLANEYGVTLPEGIGQYELFKQFVQIDFDFQPKSTGLRIEEMMQIEDEQFNELKNQLEQYAAKIFRIESNTFQPYNFAPFDYPHYWIPLDIVPLDVFGKEYKLSTNRRRADNQAIWNYSKDAASFDNFEVFYIDNSHNYNNNFKIKDEAIKTFYSRAARINDQSGSDGSIIFLSNTRKPYIGTGEKFTEEVAGLMREGISPRPNQFNDKKLLRSSLYAINIKEINTLRIHFFVGDKFYEEAFQNNRWILKELVSELHYELNATQTEVILYKYGNITDYDGFISKIISTKQPGINYRIATIE